MGTYTAILVPMLILAGILWLMVRPVRLCWKLLGNVSGGFLCLWILNSLAPYTGLSYPVNGVTTLIVGFLGLPGIGVLTLIRFLL